MTPERERKRGEPVRMQDWLHGHGEGLCNKVRLGPMIISWMFFHTPIFISQGVGYRIWVLILKILNYKISVLKDQEFVQNLAKIVQIPCLQVCLLILTVPWAARERKRERRQQHTHTRTHLTWFSIGTFDGLTAWLVTRDSTPSCSTTPYSLLVWMFVYVCVCVRECVSIYLCVVFVFVCVGVCVGDVKHHPTR